jgi:hypothetical protein
MPTNAIFIDTSVIRQFNFDVESAPFQTLRKLTASYDLRVISTDITQREIDANIDEVVEAAAAAIKKASQQAAVLKTMAPTA